MNRNLARKLGTASLLGLLSLTGCAPYRNLVDVCWPQRYNYTARREVVDGFAPQVQNGHVLDQTIWNYYFERGTDKLHPIGVEKLKYLARRRPQPDPNLFLATANDIDVDPENAEKFSQMRRELDSKRVAAVQRYLNGYMDGRQVQFEVAIHDPAEVGINATYAQGTSRLVNAATQTGPLGSLMGTQPGQTGGSTAGGNQTGRPTSSSSGQSSGGTGSSSSDGSNAPVR